jgi:hypothetical protein
MDIRQALNEEIQNTEQKLQVLNRTLDEIETIEQREHGQQIGQLGRSTGYGDRTINNQRGTQSHRQNSRNGNQQAQQNNQNQNTQGGNRGRQNFAASNDENDDRTLAGRQAHDAEEFTQEQLMQFLKNPDPNDLNDDQSFDRRTKVGRALHAAGMIDDDGFPIESRVMQGSGGNNRGSSRNR